MSAGDLSRRRVLATGLATGLGAGIAAAVGGVELPAVAAETTRPPAPRFKPVSMVLHTHSCFSEGGSYAAGGGGASMLSQLEQATKNNIDVVWWTDHDWRMEAYGYDDGIAFDGTDEDGDLAWSVQNEGTVGGTAHAFVDDPHSPDEDGKALRVTATGTSADWGVSYLWGDPGNSFFSTNISDTTLTIDVLGEQIGPDAELVVQVETSYRPEIHGRPAGVYVLEYRVGTTSARVLEKPLTGVVSVPVKDGWQALTMRLLDDIKAFWPDLIAEDSGLARLRYGVRARNNATAQAVFDHLRIIRTRDPLRWPVKTQQKLMKAYAKQYPNVKQLLAAEVSMVRHLNVFMENFELYPYPDQGKAPKLDGSVEGTEKVVRWYQERGAIVQYNHPDIKPAEFVQTRALGTDLTEVANADGNFDVIHDRINQYDAAARNAIFLTATSQVDDHAGRNWGGKSHLYTTSVWSPSKEAKDLIAALRSGQAWWFHQRLWSAGRLDLAIRGRRAMGRVIQTTAAAIPVEVIAQNLPAGSTVQVVVGLCDRSGASTPSIEKHAVPADAFTDDSTTFTLKRGIGSYLRVEVYDTDNTLIGFSNPLWLLSPHDKVPIPHARRLA
ncbi:hypothetical protein AB0I34_07745 [Kribbella sp. NPDC050281]|uniref:hypothetical protein n=1 Tax=Kribbella sp. NPDC050281 TaxID=3155515 RepID=UPI00340E9FBA